VVSGNSNDDQAIKRAPFVVVEQPAHARSTDYWTVPTRNACAAKDQRIAETLVVALVMKVGTEFSERNTKHPLPLREQLR